jgi:hypothetical protein
MPAIQCLALDSSGQLWINIGISVGEEDGEMRYF